MSGNNSNSNTRPRPDLPLGRYYGIASGAGYLLCRYNSYFSVQYTVQQHLVFAWREGELQSVLQGLGVVDLRRLCKDCELASTGPREELETRVLTYAEESSNSKAWKHSQNSEDGPSRKMPKRDNDDGNDPEGDSHPWGPGRVLWSGPSKK